MTPRISGPVLAKRLRGGRAKLAVAEIASDAGLSAPAPSLAFGL